MKSIKKETALIYCEKQFGLVDGKTASGLVRHSERYDIVGVLDSSLRGKDAGEELQEANRNIPIFADLKDALSQLSGVPDCYIYGKAPLDATIPDHERILILEAIASGMNIISGLHEFFSNDKEFVDMANENNVYIKDIRKSPLLKDLHVFTGQLSKVTVPVIAILGTDCACGKMTTAIELNIALNNAGIKSVLIATGQTGLMQGAKYGVSIDALVSQFVVGEIENSVIKAFENESPDIILVEGQGAVSHPAFMSSLGILKGSAPDGIILQHAPARKFRCDFPDLKMPTVESEIKLIESISKSEVLAIAISHENVTNEELPGVIAGIENAIGLPTTDVLNFGCKKLVTSLTERYPMLKLKIKKTVKQKVKGEKLNAYSFIGEGIDVIRLGKFNEEVHAKNRNSAIQN